MVKEEELEKIVTMLNELSEDISVPRNLRRGAREAKEILMNENESFDVRIASVMSILDELANDPNVPIHGRTAIWNIMSAIEALTSKQ